jgi:membrane-bound serine protease (ClpP class)
MGWSVKHRVLHGLADPEVTFLIGILGIIGILIELFSPGTIVPGVVGGICLVVAAIGLQMLPVNAGALVLIILGAGFFAAEMYIGGHGGFVAAGGVCVVLGSLFLIGHVDSKFYADSDFGIGWQLVAPVGAAMAVIAGTLAWKLSQSSRQRLRAGAPGLIGQVGDVREAVDQFGQGRVLVHGELWQAWSQEPIPAGARARVLAVRGLSVEVAAEKEPFVKEQPK